MNHVLKQRRRDVVIVTLKSGATFRGVLYDHDNQAIVLRSTEVVVAGSQRTPVDGELMLFVTDVAHLQLI